MEELGKEFGNPGGVNNPEGLGGKSGKVKDCQGNNVTLTKDFKRGNKADYLLARIKRDAPDIAEDYFSIAKEDPNAPGGYDHSGYIILVDKNRHIRAYCDGTDPDKVDAFMKDIQKLIDEIDEG